MKREKNDGKIVDRHLELYSTLPSEEMAQARDRLVRRLRSEAVGAGTESSQTKQTSSLAWRRLAMIPTAAAVLLAVFIAITWRQDAFAVVESLDGKLYRVIDGKTQPMHVGEKMEAGTSVRTDGGAAAVLKLSDGSRIEMHEKSELSLERAEDGTRIRLNDGSVNVTPSQQPAGNLYVQNREVTIPVVGATFQSARAPAAVSPAFDVVSIRQRPTAQSQENPGAGGRGSGPAAATPCNFLLPLVVQLDPGRIAMTNVSLYQFVSLAYGKHCRLSLEHKLLSGGPDWMESAGFDIQATLPEGAPAYTLQQLASGNAPQLQIMLQNLLADRFKLILHRSMKEVPTYNVVLMSQTSVKLSADQNPSSPPPGRTIEIRYNPLDETVSVAAASVPMAAFLNTVQGGLGRMVVDKTGLKGLIDIPRQTFDVGSVSLDWSGWLPDIFRRIGLNMEPSKDSVEALIIDHVEKPSEN